MVCSFESIKNKGGDHSCNTLRQIRERHGDTTSSSYRLNSKYDCGGICLGDLISDLIDWCIAVVQATIVFLFICMGFGLMMENFIVGAIFLYLLWYRVIN